MKGTKFIFIFGVSVGLTGCLMTREQIRESASSGRKEERSQISEAQIKKAEQAAQIDDFEENMRSLRGRVEVLENNWNQISEQNQNQENANKASAEANAKLMAFEEALLEQHMTIKLCKMTYQCSKWVKRSLIRSYDF